MVKVILDDGDYSIEATIDSGKGEVKFTVGSGNPNKLILDLTNLNHEEEIKADSQEAVIVPVKPKEKPAKSNVSLQVGDKRVNIEGVSQKDVEDMKKAAQMIQALGSMLGGGNAVKKEKSPAKDHTDKEFEEMGKDLDMFTK